MGVDPEIEFVAGDQVPLESDRRVGGFRSYSGRGSTGALAQQLLSDYEYPIGYVDKAESIQHIARELERAATERRAGSTIRSVDVIRPVFYRDNRAYLIGRVNGSDYRLPLVIALKSTPNGVLVDAVITSEDTVSIIFSFSRSYIHVDLDIVHDVVVFISDLLPHKPISEIYTVLGRAKQGKTERYRTVFNHLHSSSDRFRDAAYDRGMVMVVFTLPSYPIVFKLIRDRFAYPKTTARRDVIRAYKLVFKHDRAGRLIDAQEFRGLSFSVDRFDPPLLTELLSETSETVKRKGEDIVIEHAYIERRLAPLNRYLREATPAQARAAVIDYGQAIRDLAASNIFPGDLLLKNFGVTRHGRVIFYDYDELCLLTDCHFRDLPEARTPEEELQAGAWFYVGENDVFPEQFASFLGLTGELLEVFLAHHGALLTAEYWRNLQTRIRRGVVEEILPYVPNPQRG